jgi:chemotaxis methyl-accepting protein methylase
MDTLDKIKKMTFRDYYRNLDTNVKKNLRDSFLEKCNMPYPTFYSKMARDHFSTLEREALESLIKKEFYVSSESEGN